MTWVDWVNSEYNTGRWGNDALSVFQNVASVISDINITDMIIANHPYMTGPRSGGFY